MFIQVHRAEFEVSIDAHSGVAGLMWVSAKPGLQILQWRVFALFDPVNYIAKWRAIGMSRVLKSPRTRFDFVFPGRMDPSIPRPLSVNTKRLRPRLSVIKELDYSR